MKNRISELFRHFPRHVFLPFLLISCESHPDDLRQASITIDTTRPLHEIRDTIFGSNIQWEWNGDRILVDDAGALAWREDVIEATRQAGVSSLRFPGGALADTYQWKDGIGNRASRKPGTSYAGTEAASNFGSDEFMELSRLTGAEPVMIVNFNTTPDDAANWVEYMNGGSETRWGQFRVLNGSPEPLGVSYWEIGNEIYSPNEAGHTTATLYGEKLLQFAQAMKQVDPGVKIGAALEISFLQAAWMPPLYPHMATWNEEVLKTVGDNIDFVSLHFYTPYDKDSNEALRRLVFSGSVTFEQNLQLVRDLIDRYSSGDVELTVTEYNTFFGDTEKLDARTGGTEAALFNAMMLFSFMRNPDITVANHHSLLNNDVFGMMETYTTGELIKRPTYEIFKRLASLSGGNLLATETVSDGYVQDARGNVAFIANVPLLDTVAVAMNGEVQVAIVNRGYDEAVSTGLAFTAERAVRPYRLTILEPVDLEMSGIWKESTVELQADVNGRATFTLPPQSFALVNAIISDE